MSIYVIINVGGIRADQSGIPDLEPHWLHRNEVQAITRIDEPRGGTGRGAKSDSVSLRSL